jgi:hypothetical protein
MRRRQQGRRRRRCLDGATQFGVLALQFRRLLLLQLDNLLQVSANVRSAEEGCRCASAGRLESEDTNSQEK